MISDLKRKLRQLKKMEDQIRFFNSFISRNKQYIWDQYFSTKDIDDNSVKYNMKYLMELDRDKLKEVFEEYFIHVYYQLYKENGILTDSVYNIDLLTDLGLPPNADLESLKHKFRELAKLHHPDQGGDKDKFIDILNKYKILISDATERNSDN
ncbi:DnaJ domain-containing protein [Mobilitalea sibirica]|uniref:DnaJ domain-containing protein n=1 Tax=Mobilitalea sibirica TaxID=1462919 RepID=A0A8J7H7S2_9FIRM|nr:DnaJ domain-containing protein [Mobilitalea sibirica]MBH1939665.1 DnaJ domain-containing protein [Mobilitalea sibirica]